jgi:TolB protein
MRFLATFILAFAAAIQTQPRREVVFARVFPNVGQLKLFIAAADGTGERPLLQSQSFDYNAAWSPDGRWIVFTSERDGSADLFRVRPDGSALERLTSDPAYEDQATFSPDGRQLAFVSTRGDGFAHLWKIDLVSRRVAAVTSGRGGDFRPSWSPDGNWIAFSSSRGFDAPFAHGRWERLQLADLYVIHPDGSGLRRITSTRNFCGSPKWFPDGRRLMAYCMTSEQTLANRRPAPEAGNDTRLVLVDVATGAISDIDAGAGVKFNPSPVRGRDVGYIRKDDGDGGPGIFYSNGTKGPTGDVRAASWSPDGERVVYDKRLGAPVPAFANTFSRSPRYHLTITGTFLPAFDAAGDRYVTNTRPTPQPLGASIIVTNVNDTQSTVIYRDKDRNVLAPQWTPRGDAVIFGIGTFNAFFNGFHGLFLKPEDRVEGGAQIAMVNADGSGFHEITSGPNNNAFPTFAPDGKRFVFRTFGPEGSGLRIMNLDTKAITTLTREYDNFPLWSPRGDLVMFSRQAEGAYEIYTIRPDGTGLKRLTFTHGNDAHMAWSPDGEHIVFTSSRMGFKDEGIYTDAPQPYGEIFVMRYDGSDVEQLTDNQWEEGTPAWRPAPDARTHR